MHVEKQANRDVARGDKQYVRKSADRKAQTRQYAVRNEHLTDLCFAI